MQSALTKVKGVSKATVSMPDKAVIEAKEGVTTKTLIAAVKAAGFGASEKIEVETK